MPSLAAVHSAELAGSRRRVSGSAKLNTIASASPRSRSASTLGASAWSPSFHHPLPSLFLLAQRPPQLA
jgi:hypothetical protein